MSLLSVNKVAISYNFLLSFTLFRDKKSRMFDYLRPLILVLSLILNLFTESVFNAYWMREPHASKIGESKQHNLIEKDLAVLGPKKIREQDSEKERIYGKMT
jgi:hypothetical protein